MDRALLGLGVLFLLGGIAAACTFWAGVAEAGPIAFLLGGSTVAALMPVGINQWARWGVPGDERPLRSEH